MIHDRLHCPCCGYEQANADVLFAHVQEEHPEAFAELNGLSGMEVTEPERERESALDLVEMVERITARGGRRNLY